MQMLDAPPLVGLPESGYEPASHKDGGHKTLLQEGRMSLIDRGLVLPSENGVGDKAEGLLLKCAVTSFFPDSVLVVVRSLPQRGDQVLLFFRRAEYLLLHTFPEEGLHRMQPIEDPHWVEEMLLDWFPLHTYVRRESSLRLSKEGAEELRALAERGEEDAALDILADQPMASEDKLALIHAMENRVISGSFAVLYPEGREIEDAFSLAAIADDESAWLLGVPLDEEGGDQLYIVRVGYDFEITLHGLVGKWLQDSPGV
jgi:hypothetical protein